MEDHAKILASTKVNGVGWNHRQESTSSLERVDRGTPICRAEDVLLQVRWSVCPEQKSYAGPKAEGATRSNVAMVPLVRKGPRAQHSSSGCAS